VSSSLEIDLVSANTEAADDQKLGTEGEPTLQQRKWIRTLVAALRTFFVILVLLRIPIPWYEPIFSISSSSEKALV